MAEEQSCPNCGKPYQIGDEVCRHCGLVFPFSTVVIAPGRILQGRYEIQELIHTGGMGYIYSAKDKRLYDRPCIVKQVRESIKSESHQKKLEEEALSMTKLTNPNIAMIFDHFVEGGYYFLVVERIAGKTLGEVLKERQGRFTEKEVLDWSVTICDVVGYLHSKGVIHRDISPDNIMLTEDNNIKFIDFGTSHEFRYYGSGGTVGIGKYGYTPPEQWRGKPEHRSDIFALGATIYYLLTGFLPLSHAYSTGKAPQKEDFNPEFPPIRTKNPNISARLEAALQKALQLDIEKRYSSAAEFGQALKGLEKGKKEKPAAPAGQGKKITRSGWFWTGTPLSLVTIVLLIVFAFGAVDKQTPPYRIEMYWAIIIFCIPLIIGAFCLGRGLSRGNLAKRSWLWSGGAFLVVEAVLLFFLAGNFVALTGRTTDQEELLIFFTLVAAGAPFIALSIYCFIRGLRLGSQPQPVPQPVQMPVKAARAWTVYLVSAIGLVIIIALAFITSQQTTEAGRHGLIMTMLLFCVPVLIIGNCLLGTGLLRRQPVKRRWFQWGGGLISIGLVLAVILLICFTSIGGVTNQERAFFLLILFGAGASYLVLAIYCFIRGQRQGTSPQAALPAKKRAVSPWTITCVSLVVAFLGISWITGAATNTPSSPDPTTKQVSQTTTPPKPTPTDTPTSQLTPIEIVKSLKFESADAVFDKNMVNGNEVFNVTISGKITCVENLKAPVTEIYLDFEVFAKKTTGGNEVTLNPDYEFKMPSSLKVANDAVPFTQKIQLQFPEQAEQGDYQVIMRNKVCKINADSWLDITAYLPKEQTLGTVAYLPSAAATYDYYFVEGYVYDAASSAPISGATVEVVNTRMSDGNPSEEVVAKTQSNNDGYFKTQKFVNSGPLKVRASASGYETGWYDNTNDKAKATEVYFKKGGETLNFKISLQRLGSISGRVIADADGKPIADLHVYASDYVTDKWMSGVNTSSDGTYKLTNLPAGTYRLRVWPTQTKKLFVHEFYNNTYDFNLAQQVKVNIGQEVTGIDFSLAPGGIISGSVRSADGSTPLANVSVECFDNRGGYSSTTTDNQGNYTIYGAPYGQNYVRAPSNGRWAGGDGDYAQEYFREASGQSNATPVTVGRDNSPTNINFTLARGGSISGKVIADANSQSIASVSIVAWDYTTGEWLSSVATGEDGTYTIHGLPPGSYRVKAMPSSNNHPYIDEFYNNTYDNGTAQPVMVTAGRDTGGINFSLALGGTISGVVRNAGGSTPLANISVECITLIDGQWQWTSTRGATTDSEGKYTFYGIPDGTYCLKAPAGGRWGANDGDYVQEFYPEKIRQAEATLVTISNSANLKYIDFSLTAGGSISGKVVSETTLEGIFNVHVFATDYTTGEWMSGTFTSTDGTYTLHGLPAGSLRVMAMPSLNNLPYIDEYYKDTIYSERAQAVNVTAGKDTPGINFILAPKSYGAASIQRAAGLSPPFGLSYYLKDICYRRNAVLQLY